MDIENKKLITQSVVYFSVIFLIAMLLGFVIRKISSGQFVGVIGVGLLVGIALMGIKTSNLRIKIVLIFAGTLFGIATFMWFAHLKSWDASNEIKKGDVDSVCQKIVALQICHERNMMGIFDYENVPKKIQMY